MTFLHQPPRTPETPREPPADDLDGLLREFFQAQMPVPWPRLRLPEAAESAPAPSRRRGSLLRSRLALAASVALLILSYLFLAGTFHTDEAPRLGTGPDVSHRPGHAPAKKFLPDKPRDPGPQKFHPIRPGDDMP